MLWFGRRSLHRSGRRRIPCMRYIFGTGGSRSHGQAGICFFSFLFHEAALECHCPVACLDCPLVPTFCFPPLLFVLFGKFCVDPFPSCADRPALEFLEEVPYFLLAIYTVFCPLYYSDEFCYNSVHERVLLFCCCQATLQVNGLFRFLQLHRELFYTKIFRQNLFLI